MPLASFRPETDSRLSGNVVAAGREIPALIFRSLPAM